MVWEPFSQPYIKARYQRPKAGSLAPLPLLLSISPPSPKQANVTKTTHTISAKKLTVDQTQKILINDLQNKYEMLARTHMVNFGCASTRSHFSAFLKNHSPRDDYSIGITHRLLEELATVSKKTKRLSIFCIPIEMT